MQSIRVSLPGKVFVLGEYAVLRTGRAWVATVSPRFELLTHAEHRWQPHSESPAGKFLASSAPLAEADREPWDGLSFFDPWRGAGGFGASTAQFGALYFLRELLAQRNPGASHVWQAWEAYQSVQSPDQRGSGADLVAQWLGGMVAVDLEKRQTRSLSSEWDWNGLLIFSATARNLDRKVSTHTHLRELTRLPDSAVRELNQLLTRAEQAIAGDPMGRKTSPRQVGECLTQYAQILQKLELEHPATTADRRALSDYPGVLGAKGCGALGADTVIVLWDHLKADPALLPALLADAQARGLTLLSNRFISERGVTWQLS